MSYVNILHAFLVRRKHLLAFLQAREKLTVSHIFAQLSCQILSYINKCNINRKLLAQAFTWM